MSAVPADTIGLESARPHACARARTRLQSIDVLRGLVIVLMALDHVRVYFSGVRFDPLDLTQSDAPLFFTRWFTHFCAPIFIFLAGTSAWLVSRRCTRAELSRFLLTRGAWLILLEFTVVQFGWSFNLRYEFGLIMQVIWAIGASMIVLAALVHLPVRAVGATGLVMIVGHNALDGIAPESFGAWAPLWNLLHVQEKLPYAMVYYPLIPWIGVMAVGFAAGTLYGREPAQRRRILLTLGLTAIAVFVLLRLVNGYGDPYPWAVQATPVLTVMSFLNVHKYPPSLLYLLVTLGPALVLLALFEGVRGRVADVLERFGRVPLLFYVGHILLAHLAAGLVALALGYGPGVLTNIFLALPENWGFGLGVVYLAWAGVLVALYPLCRWFAEVKRRRSDWWLSYL